jgi:hypothetical protein
MTKNYIIDQWNLFLLKEHNGENPYNLDVYNLYTSNYCYASGDTLKITYILSDWCKERSEYDHYIPKFEVNFDGITYLEFFNITIDQIPTAESNDVYTMNPNNRSNIKNLYSDVKECENFDLFFTFDACPGYVGEERGFKINAKNSYLTIDGVTDSKGNLLIK